MITQAGMPVPLSPHRRRVTTSPNDFADPLALKPNHNAPQRNPHPAPQRIQDLDAPDRTLIDQPRDQRLSDARQRHKRHSP
jgi:hypothetical protein